MYNILNIFGSTATKLIFKNFKFNNIVNIHQKYIFCIKYILNKSFQVIRANKCGQVFLGLTHGAFKKLATISRKKEKKKKQRSINVLPFQ